MQQVAQGIAALGRGQDKMLVHMTPGEVGGLQQLAMAHGGSLTINPQTGLPEAGFLSSMLPILAGVASSAMGMGPVGTALVTGGVTAATSGSLTKGLMAGLGAYGMSGIGESLASAGKNAAMNSTSAAATEAGQEAARTALTNDVLNPVLPQAPAPQAASNWGGALDDYGQPLTGATPAAQTAGPGSNYEEFMRARAADEAASAVPYKANAPVMGSQRLGDMYAGAQQPGALGKAVMSRNGLMAAAGLLPMASDMLGTKGGAPNPYTSGSSFRPVSAYDRAQAQTKPGYGEQLYFTGGRKAGVGNSLANYGYAEGGIAGFDNFDFAGESRRTPQDRTQQSLDRFGEPTRYADGGGVAALAQPRSQSSWAPPQQFTQENSGFFDAAPQQPARAPYVPFSLYGPEGYQPPPTPAPSNPTSTTPATTTPAAPAATPQWQTLGWPSENVWLGAGSPTRFGYNDYLDYYNSIQFGGGGGAAAGGLMSLPGSNTYAAGGRLLRGPGDGVSDSIPAVIDGPNPQKAALADGEFVLPARIVSELGNGSTEAGARKLYAMMDRVQHARKKSVGKDKVAVNTRAEKLLPA